MRHDVVLVQTRVPISCDMVETDLDVEDEKNLVEKISHDPSISRISDTYRVVLVDALPRNSWEMLVNIRERGR
jgi:hypothetical protein